MKEDEMERAREEREMNLKCWLDGLKGRSSFET
jgi:hypothetical protein